MDEYIKRSEVVGLVEDKIKRCETVLEAIDFASLRTEVMGLRSADVAPRAEVAREIFEEIEDALESCYDPDINADYPSPCYNLWLADRIDELKKEYTDIEPPKGDHHE